MVPALARLAWPQVPDVLAAGQSLAIWPFGATEQHGPHLACGTDTVIATKIGEAVAEKTSSLLLPTQPIGCSLGHTSKWPGTLSLRPQTMVSFVEEVGAWLVSFGVKRLLLLNAHVTNAAPLRCALECLRYDHPELQVSLVNTPEISPRVRQIFFSDGNDWHANRAETSLMLYLAPEMVLSELVNSSDDPDRTANCHFAHPVSSTSTNGVTGQPSLASCREGEDLYMMMVEDLTRVLSAAQQEVPPLSISGA